MHSKQENNVPEKLCKKFGEGGGGVLASTNTAVNGFFNNSVPHSNREPPAKSTARSSKCHVHVVAKEML